MSASSRCTGDWEEDGKSGSSFAAFILSPTQTKRPCSAALSSGREIPLCLPLYATGEVDKALLSKISNQMGR